MRLLNLLWWRLEAALSQWVESNCCIHLPPCRASTAAASQSGLWSEKGAPVSRYKGTEQRDYNTQCRRLNADALCKCDQKQINYVISFSEWNGGDMSSQPPLIFFASCGVCLCYLLKKMTIWLLEEAWTPRESERREVSLVSNALHRQRHLSLSPLALPFSLSLSLVAAAARLVQFPSHRFRGSWREDG